MHSTHESLKIFLYEINYIFQINIHTVNLFFFKLKIIDNNQKVYSYDQ